MSALDINQIKRLFSSAEGKHGFGVEAHEFGIVHNILRQNSHLIQHVVLARPNDDIHSQVCNLGLEKKCIFYEDLLQKGMDIFIVTKDKATSDTMQQIISENKKSFLEEDKKSYKGCKLKSRRNTGGSPLKQMNDNNDNYDIVDIHNKKGGDTCPYKDQITPNVLKVKALNMQEHNDKGYKLYITDNPDLRFKDSKGIQINLYHFEIYENNYVPLFQFEEKPKVPWLDEEYHLSEEPVKKCYLSDSKIPDMMRDKNRLYIVCPKWAKLIFFDYIKFHADNILNDTSIQTKRIIKGNLMEKEPVRWSILFVFAVMIAQKYSSTFLNFLAADLKTASSRCRNNIRDYLKGLQRCRIYNNYIQQSETKHIPPATFQVDYSYFNNSPSLGNSIELFESFLRLVCMQSKV